ncbi:GIY-YIG nuclease family protein [Salinicola lusitanus]|uniref:GIY-YIG nuclease family protein n=1 Tax=Salinicola lusitanus TaxID=1949085 RepID=UPI000DA20B94
MASEYGFVYVLYSPSMPGVYKVGMTTRSPNQRAQELSRATGVPEDYEVVFYAEFARPSEHESRVHCSLGQYRVNQVREFFRCPLNLIMRAIEGDGEFLSSYDSDLAIEARNPGSIFPHSPLSFESCLHSEGPGRWIQ